MKKLFSLLLLCALLAGCGYASVSRDSFESMDTFMQIEIYGGDETAAKIRAEIERLDGLLSTTDAESDIYRLNRDGAAEIDMTTFELLEKAQNCCLALDNDLDIFVYPLVEAWGFISRDYTVPDQATIDKLLPDARTARVRLIADGAAGSYRAEMIGSSPKLDLGAVAKGYAADRAADIMAQDGVTAGVLNLGGTVAAVGKKPDGSLWRVGICDPENTADYFGSVAVSDKFVATSGSYERYFERDGRRYCHIIDPKTGCPVDNGTVSVTVISGSGVKSDALSTALFVKGAEGAQAYWRENRDFEYILLDDRNTLYVTAGIEQDFRLLGDSGMKIERVE